MCVIAPRVVIMCNGCLIRPHTRHRIHLFCGAAYTNPSPSYAQGHPITPNAPVGECGEGLAFEVSEGKLPAGLVLDSASGVLSGTPAGQLGANAYIQCHIIRPPRCGQLVMLPLVVPQIRAVEGSIQINNTDGVVSTAQARLSWS